jgi:hypothetical protein
MTDAATEARWDAARDRAKHDGPRPHDPIPLRLQPVISPALEIALLVKGLDNLTAAANLIEQYAQTVAAGAKLEGIELVATRILDAFDVPHV